MFILNEEIKEQERQAIRELYPKFQKNHERTINTYNLY